MLYYKSFKSMGSILGYPVYVQSAMLYDHVELDLYISHTCEILLTLSNSFMLF